MAVGSHVLCACWLVVQRALESYNTSLEKAQQSFQKKFVDKSGNEWPLEGPFEKFAGKYVLVGAFCVLLCYCVSVLYES